MTIHNPPPPPPVRQSLTLRTMLVWNLLSSCLGFPGELLRCAPSPEAENGHPNIIGSTTLWTQCPDLSEGSVADSEYSQGWTSILVCHLLCLGNKLFNLSIQIFLIFKMRITEQLSPFMEENWFQPPTMEMQIYRHCQVPYRTVLNLTIACIQHPCFCIL